MQARASASMKEALTGRSLFKQYAKVAGGVFEGNAYKPTHPLGM